MSTRLTTKQAEDEIMERWQFEHRTERELDAHGFRGDDEVVAILGDMEDEVRMEDLKPHAIHHVMGVQFRSRYDAEKPPRSAPAVMPSHHPSGLDYELLNAGEVDDDDT